MLVEPSNGIERRCKGPWTSRLDDETALETQETTVRIVSGSRILSAHIDQKTSIVHIADLIVAWPLSAEVHV